MDIFEMIGTDSLQQVATGLARLMIAAVCGAIIGINRERRRRASGGVRAPHPGPDGPEGQPSGLRSLADPS